MELNKLKTDTKLENEGTRIPFGDGYVVIVSSQSERYKQAQKRLLAPHESAIALNVMDEKTAQELEIQLIAEGVILDWGGITEDKAPLPFSTPNAVRVLKEVPMFKRFVVAQLGNHENFQKKVENIETKNSETASAGS